MMAEIYGRKDGLCKGIGGPMHLADPSNGFLGTSGIVAAGIPHATGAGLGGADPQGGSGRALLLRRRRLEAGRVLRVAEHRVAVEAPDRLRDGEQRLQRPHAHRAGGRELGANGDLSVKAKAFSMPGVTIDGRDPIAVYETVGAAVARARAGDGPTLVESQMYRLSAHGNIIALPGVPLHFRSTRRSRSSARPRSTRPP